MPIVILQKKLIRLIHDLSWYSHCALYASLSGILFLPDEYSLMLCLFANKVFHNLSVPNTICSLFIRIQHSHPTRVASHNFFVTFTRSNIYHDSPIPTCIMLCIFANKVFHNLSVPYTICSLFNRIQHSHSTRVASHNFFVTFTRLNIYHDSPIPTCIMLCIFANKVFHNLSVPYTICSLFNRIQHSHSTCVASHNFFVTFTRLNIYHDSPIPSCIMLCIFANKVFHNLSVPYTICSLFNRIQHSHSTRVASHNFFVTFTRLKIYHDSPIPSCIMLCIFANKVFHNLSVPYTICSLFNRIQHSHSTRVASHNFFVTFTRLKIYHDSPIPSCIMLCIFANKVFHNLSVPYTICSLFNRIQHSHSTRVASHNFFVTFTRLKIYHDSPIPSCIMLCIFANKVFHNLSVPYTICSLFNRIQHSHSTCVASHNFFVTFTRLNIYHDSPVPTCIMLCIFANKVFHNLSVPYTICSLFNRIQHSHSTRVASHNFFVTFTRLKIYHDSPVPSCIMLCIFANKVFYNLSVPYTICLLFNRIQHSHSTRVASHNFFVTFTRLKIYHDSPIPSSIHLWNNLSINIKMSSSLCLLKLYMMCTLFSNYL